jgi:hypothetical protein
LNICSDLLNVFSTAKKREKIGLLVKGFFGPIIIFISWKENKEIKTNIQYSTPKLRQNQIH